MIRFFHKIRKTLMEQNKIRTYLLYAVGEITLVMIGILLALQVNNWNESRKEANMEVFYLQKLRQNLMQDTTLYSRSYNSALNHITDIKYLSEAIQDKELEQFEINPESPLLRTVAYAQSTATWDNLQATGNIQLISNEKISEGLYNYYSNAQVNNLGITDAIDSYSRTVLGPFFMEFDIVSFDAPDSLQLPFNYYQKSPADYAASVLYKNGLSFKLSAFRALSGIIMENKKPASEMLSLIEAELAD